MGTQASYFFAQFIFGVSCLLFGTATLQFAACTSSEVRPGSKNGGNQKPQDTNGNEKKNGETEKDLDQGENSGSKDRKKVEVDEDSDLPDTDEDCIPKPDQGSVRLFILGGQSNAVRLSDESLRLALQKSFEKIYPADRIYLAKYAANSTHLAGDWLGNGSETATGDGAHYVAFQNAVKNQLATLRTANPDREIRLNGMVWMQGESDALNTGYAEAYETNLKTFIEDVRATFGIPKLTFVLGRLSTGQLAYPFLNVVRTAQDAVAKQDPNVAAVSLESLTVAPDGGHFSAESYPIMARLFADATKNLQFPGLEDGSEFCQD